MTKRYLAMSLCMASFALAATAAKADMTIHSQITMNAPAAHGQAGAPNLGGMNMQTTTYFSGKKARIDQMMISIIADASAKKVTLLNTMARTYSTHPMTPMMPPGVPGAAAAGARHATVTDTGHTKTILGHLCREYIADVTSPSPMGGVPMQMRVDAWVAPDLAADPALQTLSASPLSGAEQMRKIKGYPLKMTVTYIKAPPFLLGMSTTIAVTSIDTHPVAASEFGIPSGYTQAPAGPPLPGAPMARH